MELRLAADQERRTVTGMKKRMGSFAAAVFYLILMCFLLGEDLVRLLDAGLLGMLLLGSAILCLPYMESGKSYRQMKEIFAGNILMTGYIETFMLLFVSLQSRGEPGRGLLARLALDFRPLFYGFAGYLILGRGSLQAQQEPEKEDGQGMREEKEPQTDGETEKERGEMRTQEQEGQAGRIPGDEPVTKDSVPDFSLLSSRERQVAQLIRRGLSNREIGEELYISEATVKKHVSHIFEKLGIDSRKDLK